MAWKTLDGKPIEDIAITVESILLKAIAEGTELKICIGADSQVYSKIIEFATAIVFIRKGNGGFMLVKKEREKVGMGIKERMILEVSKAVQTAYSLSKLWDKYNVDIEVHADINTDPSFKSSVALKEAMGYILGMGYKFKAKPDAFASSSCANKVVH
jgi:predicted RNase H-related nuclease YkuK (DUF458 family)